jgi:hypothetical protein
VEIASQIVLLLLTLVGYSSGATLAMPGRQVVPGLIDLAGVSILWAAALVTANAMGRWSGILIWFVVGLFIGIVLARMRALEFPAHRSMPKAGTQGETLFRRIHSAWGEFARKMGNYQSRILIMFVYFTVILPFGVGLRILGHPLDFPRIPNGTGWIKREIPNASFEEVRRQG